MTEWMEWIDMSQSMQQVRLFARMFSVHKKKTFLTVSELELMSWLLLSEKRMTPLLLSRRMGMQKESISRLLKKLWAKQLIQKEKQDCDERSYLVILTEKGEKELDSTYRDLLSPLYQMKKEMGTEEFSSFMKSIRKANDILKNFSQEERNLL